MRICFKVGFLVVLRENLVVLMVSSFFLMNKGNLSLMGFSGWVGEDYGGKDEGSYASDFF